MAKGSKSVSCLKMGYEPKGGEDEIFWPSSVDDLRCVAFSAADSGLLG